MPENGNGRKINIGDWIHIVEIAALLISLGMNYQKFEQIAVDVGRHTETLTRIEHYLSSKDPEYWQKSHADQ